MDHSLSLAIKMRQQLPYGYGGSRAFTGAKAILPNGDSAPTPRKYQGSRIKDFVIFKVRVLYQIHYGCQVVGASMISGCMPDRHRGARYMAYLSATTTMKPSFLPSLLRKNSSSCKLLAFMYERSARTKPCASRAMRVSSSKLPPPQSARAIATTC